MYTIRKLLGFIKLTINDPKKIKEVSVIVKKQIDFFKKNKDLLGKDSRIIEIYETIEKFLDLYMEMG